MPTWSEAFAAQAASDLDAYEHFLDSTLPVCHRLHYLQMWLEKLCKAFLYMPGSGAEELRRKHNVVAKVLPRLVFEHWQRTRFASPGNAVQISQLCREIDLLQPQVDDSDRRPDNSEYPWLARSGAIEIPARWTYPIASRLETSPGRLLIKAAVHLTRNPTSGK